MLRVGYSALDHDHAVNVIKHHLTAALADQRQADAAICDLEAEQRRARAAGAQERGNLHVAEEYKLLADHSVMLAQRIRGGGKE